MPRACHLWRTFANVASGADQLDRFLDLCCEEIARRASLAIEHRESLTAGAAAFRDALRDATPTDRGLSTVPVAQHVAGLEPSAASTAAITAAAKASQAMIPWIATPRLSDDGESVALAPLDEVRDLGSLICGLMLLAPGAAYPEHEHPPHEIYLPIAGHGRWRYGGASQYQVLEPDALVYNHPNDRHGAVADDSPLLALYVLWS